MRKTIFVLIFLLLLVLAGCQKADTNVSQPDTSAPSLVIVETQEDESSTTQTSSAEEPKKTESNTSHEETETASGSTTSKPATTETSSPQLNIETSDNNKTDENSETKETSKGTVSSATEPEETTATETEAPPPDNATAEDSAEIAQLVTKYINEYRTEQGTSAAVYLPGLTQYAEYRSRQIISDFSHNTRDERAAATALQYGEYIEPALYGMSGEPYYTAGAGEAIAKAGYVGTPDYVASSLAKLIRNSAKHWCYIGAAEYQYIGVGITYESGMWYCDVAMTRENQG